LRLVGSTMTVDLFDFDSWVHALAEYALINERNGKPFNLKIHDLVSQLFNAKSTASPIIFESSDFYFFF